MSESLHPAAPHHLPGFITAPGDTDTLMVVVGLVLIGSILMVRNLYLHFPAASGEDLGDERALSAV